MKRLILAATPTVAAVVLVASPKAEPVLARATPPHRDHRRWCHRFYTVRGTRARARMIFAGTAPVRVREYRELGYREMCLAHEAMRGPVRAFDRQMAIRHRRRVRGAQEAAQRPLVASWYNDAGATASGWHAYYGVANRSLPFGTRIRICYPYRSSRCVQATADDRGPYVSGRDLDLNQNVAAALGFDGVDTVGYTLG